MGKKFASYEHYGELLKLLEQEYDISREDLTLLYMLAKESCSVLELGVRDGISTRALVWGLADSFWAEKRMLSVDNGDIKDTVFEAMKPFPFWEFKNIDDRHLELDGDDEFDIVFIDTSHGYEHTKVELQKFGKFANCWIICHDYCTNTPGVIRAVDEYCREHNYEKTVTNSKYPFAIIHVEDRE